MKIKYIVPVLALMGTLAACDDYNDQFGFLDENGITDKKNLQVTLGGNDYKTIAKSEVNQSIAQVKQDQGSGNYVEALNAVAENKYFTADAPAADYIPVWLENAYPEATDGSRIKVAFNEFKGTSPYLEELGNIKTYTLTEDDYKTAWGNGDNKIMYLTPKTATKVSDVLKDAFANAASGDKVLVNYAYDVLEPSVPASDAVVAYVQVKEMAEEGGKYIVAAQDKNGKYYAFGNTGSWTKNYGNFYPTEALSVESGQILVANGEADELLFEKGKTGYTLKDKSGYYVYMAGTYTNFNRTTSVPTEGAEWSFTANTDGTVTMTNVEKNKIVKLTYNSSNNLYYLANTAETFAGNVYFEDPCATIADAKFTIKDVTLPEGSTYVWKVDENKKYWKASAFVSNANKVSESYIVSNEIDLTSAKTPYLSWTEILNFVKTGQTVNDFAVYVSSNYLGDVTKATWESLTPSVRGTGSSWSEVYPEVDLSAYKGKKIVVAFKYVSTTASAATWEIFNVKVEDKLDFWNVCLFKGMTQSEIDETTRASEVRANTSVLYAFNGTAWSEYKPEGATAIAVDPETYQTVGAEYLLKPEVQIPIFLSKKCPYAVNGSVMAVAYNNIAGKVVVDEYKYTSGVWKGTTSVVVKRLPFEKKDGKWVPGANSYNESSLLGDEGGFVKCDVELSSGLTYVWTNTTTYGWKASAFLSKVNYPSVSWLVSPTIDLSEAESPVLSFDEAVNFANGNMVDDILGVYVTKDADKFDDKSPSIDGCTWTKLSFEQRAAGDSWTYVNVGQADLSGYVGEKIRIAFKYTSTDSYAATWEFKNFSVAERTE